MSGKRIFGGAKILLHHKGVLLTYMRDNKQSIPFSAFWDLPGGGAEKGETPIECALRETFEEFALCIPSSRITWERAYENPSDPNAPNWFFAAPLKATEINAIIFGNEGQHWQMMPIERYLKHPKAIPHLQGRVRDALA